jgi:predicted ATP-grasp superfamily ATP-dependent carboligase
MKNYENKYKNIRVAVTDGGYKHSLGIVRKLGEIGVKPYVIAHKKRSIAGISKYAKDEMILTETYDLKELLQLLNRHKIELVILVGTNSFRKIVPWKKELERENIKIITVDADVQNIAFSKPLTYELAVSMDVPIPKTIYPTSFKMLKEIEDEIIYPCVIKGLYEVGGNIVDYAYDFNDLLLKYEKICNKYGLTERSGLPMLQEYIPGYGCAFFAIYNKGTCGLTFQHKRIREYPVTGGASSCAESYKSDMIEKYGRCLLDKLEWHGVAMVEFKLNKKGQPILMEINPKFWGSTDLALEAGVNFPKALMDIYLNEEIEYSNFYKYPFRYHWPFDGDILHIIDKPKNILNFFKDLFNFKVKTNIHFSDPLPSLYMAAVFIRSLPIILIRKLYV